MNFETVSARSFPKKLNFFSHTNFLHSQFIILISRTRIQNHASTRSDQNKLKRIYVEASKKQFPLSNSPSLVGSNYSHLSDKISHCPRGCFYIFIWYSSKVMSSPGKRWRCSEGLEYGGIACVNLTYKTFPKCVHFIFNKTYIKYCSVFRRRLERSVWNITKRVWVERILSLKLWI